MNRLEVMRSFIGALMDEIEDEDDRRLALIHLSTTSEFAAFLADVRGENPELAAIAGLVHDYAKYKKTNCKCCNNAEHGELGAVLIRDALLNTGLFETDEIETICIAINNHSKKAETHEPMSEILKDADIMSHIYFDSTNEIKDTYLSRYQRMMNDFKLK